MDYRPSKERDTVTSQGKRRVEIRDYELNLAGNYIRSVLLGEFHDLLVDPSLALTDTKVDKIDVTRLRDYPVAGTAINATQSVQNAEEMDKQARIAQAQAAAAQARYEGVNDVAA